MRKTVGAVVAVAGLLVACAPAEPGTQSDPEPPVHAQASVDYEQIPLEEADALGDVIDNCMAMGLVAVENAMGENIVFSPVSWCMALGMLAGGATEDGLEQVETALGASVEDGSRALNALGGELARFEDDPSVVSEEELPEHPVLHRAMSAVARDDLDVEQDYLNHLARFFDVDVARADLTSDEGMEVLSEWVREHTGGRIQDTAIEPNPELVLVLQDALLFAAAWSREFPEPRLTMDFTNFDGSVVQPRMVQDARTMNYSYVDGWKSGQVPFTSDFTATFILPPVDTEALTPQLRERILGQMERTDIDLQFPRFTLETRVDLLEHLDAWDLGSLKEPEALPLEGIQPDRGLHVQQAQQQAMIDVSETGTVAVAVTEVGVEEMAQAPPETALHLVRPFYMLITHDASGTDIFQVAIRQLESSDDA